MLIILKIAKMLQDEEEDEGQLCNKFTIILFFCILLYFGRIFHNLN